MKVFYLYPFSFSLILSSVFYFNTLTFSFVLTFFLSFFLKVVEGKVKMDAPLGLLKELRTAGYALSCCAFPRSDNIVLQMQSEDEMFVKQWSEGFEGGGKEWGGFFMDEDD